MKFLKQNFVKYGLFMTGVIVLCLLFMEITGQNQSFDKSSLELAMLAAPVIVWYLGIRAKKRLLKNKMTFKQGFIEGFKISLVYGLVSPFVFLFYYVAINPEIVAYVRKAYGLTNAPDSTVIHVDMLVTFATAIVMGAILSAVVSYFLKSKNK